MFVMCYLKYKCLVIKWRQCSSNLLLLTFTFYVSHIKIEAVKFVIKYFCGLFPHKVHFYTFWLCMYFIFLCQNVCVRSFLQLIASLFLFFPLSLSSSAIWSTNKNLSCIIFFFFIFTLHYWYSKMTWQLFLNRTYAKK